MSHPLRENLEIFEDDQGSWVRCTKCSFRLCRKDEEWRRASRRKLLPPTKAGPLMADLEGQYLLEQLYCPSCAALFDTQVVEAEKQESAKEQPST